MLEVLPLPTSTASKWPTSPSERLRDVRTGWVTFDPKRRPNPAISVDVWAIRGKRKPNVTQTFDVKRRPIAVSLGQKLHHSQFATL
ncbi:hypothetical protein Pst134EB_008014 [Puccinia striiformis f. sp. tritici]|nr:hypothetical protein Pst134EB_008014 [Puccinia striiformis f. sp. tritici]